MKPYAEVIGDPIAHSKSPLIHSFWLDQLVSRLPPVVTYYKRLRVCVVRGIKVGT